MDAIQQIKQAALSHAIPVWENADMRKYTSFKIGGPAALLLTPKTTAQLIESVTACNRSGLAYYIVGKGSNLLVSDDGISGVVIVTTALDSIEISGKTIRCGAGVTLKQLCEAAQQASLTGLEFAYGIPGTAGGALFMNAGAYGGEMRDVVTSAIYLDEKNLQTQIMAEQMQLEYRSSIFQHKPWIITEIIVQLAEGNATEIHARMQEIITKRREKQPLQYPSAGSMFKRPPGHYAGALIEQCGLRGKQIGGAQVSEKHCGFIVNRGGASEQDVTQLIAFVQETIKKQTGVLLEPEVKRIP